MVKWIEKKQRNRLKPGRQEIKINMNTAIIDYGMGNLTSVNNAVEYLGFDCEIINNPDLISKFDKLILPGVGAFEACINNLKIKNFVKSLNEEVLTKKKTNFGHMLGDASNG